MLIKNYLSKLQLGYAISRNLSTFIKLMINSKRFSSTIKNGQLLKNNEIINYQFVFKNKFVDFKIRTFTGDIDIFYEIFWDKEYTFPQNFLDKDPEVIIDLGAHIGFTSIFLALKYPNAKIISLEPSKENFELLEYNTKSFKNVICINEAINDEDGCVYFGTDAYSYNQKISDRGQLVHATSLKTLIKKYNIKSIDLIKIDIEGAEVKILNKNNYWLNIVKNMIIEIHRPYDQIMLERDLKPFDLQVKIHKKSLLFLKK